MNGFIIAGSSPSVLLRTTNGGFNWTPVLTNNNFTSLNFLNANTGAVLGKDTIYKTFDGGNNWTMIATNITPGNLFQMMDANKWMYVRGQHWGNTFDGGNTWSDSTHGNAGILPIFTTDLQFINGTTLIGVGWYGASTFESIDGGLNWTGLGAPIANYFWSCCFVSSTTCFATGASSGVNKIFKSVNGAVNWTIIDSTLGFGIYSLRQIDVNNLYGVGYAGGIAKTTDGGINWVNDVSPTTNNLNKIIFINSHTAIAIGDTGTILMNSNIVTEIKNVNSNDNLISVFPNPSNSILNIQNNSLQPIHFTLYNLLGEKLIDKTLSKNISTIDLSDYSSDIYFYRLSNDEHIMKSGKIIKQ